MLPALRRAAMPTLPALRRPRMPTLAALRRAAMPARRVAVTTLSLIHI